VVASFVFAATAPEADWARALLIVLECSTLIVALWTSGLGEDYRPGLVLVAVAVIAAVGLLVNQGNLVEGLVWLSW